MSPLSPFHRRWRNRKVKWCRCYHQAGDPGRGLPTPPSQPAAPHWEGGRFWLPDSRTTLRASRLPCCPVRFPGAHKRAPAEARGPLPARARPTRASGQAGLVASHPGLDSRMACCGPLSSGLASGLTEPQGRDGKRTCLSPWGHMLARSRAIRTLPGPGPHLHAPRPSRSSCARGDADATVPRMGFTCGEAASGPDWLRDGWMT